MDRINAVLEEMDLKAANSSNAYELIMDLMKEASSNFQAQRGNDGKPGDRGQ